jgi:Protein of unknown function (DUF2510)
LPLTPLTLDGRLMRGVKMEGEGNREGIAVGWHPDPSGVHEMRYWDGGSWTERVTDQSRESIDPMEHPAHSADSRVAAESDARTGSAETTRVIKARMFMKDWTIAVSDEALAFAAIQSGETFEVSREDSSKLLEFPLTLPYNNIIVTIGGRRYQFGMSAQDQRWLRSWVPGASGALPQQLIGLVIGLVVFYLVFQYIRR